MATYSQHHRSENGRSDWCAERDNLDIEVYEIPQPIQAYTISCAAFWSQNAMRYSQRRLSNPPGVVEGAVTCLKAAFAEKIGGDVIQRNGATGLIRGRDGAVVLGWRPFFPRYELKVEMAQWADLAAYGGQLAGGEIYASPRFILILREDLFERVKDFSPKSCKITEWSSTDGAVASVRPSIPQSGVAGGLRKKVEKDPYLREVIGTWKKATKGLRGDAAAEAFNQANREMQGRKREDK